MSGSTEVVNAVSGNCDHMRREGCGDGRGVFVVIGHFLVGVAAQVSATAL